VTDTPPVIDGTVKVGDTWPAEAYIDHTYIAGGKNEGDIPTTDVYMMFDILTDYPYNQYNKPEGYTPDDEVGYYLYIGIKAIDGYEIEMDGNWVVIDWDQDGIIDFADHNGNSAEGDDPYSTVYAWRCGQGVEWKIPYIDEFNGYCQSEVDILIHIQIITPDDKSVTTTFPGRGGKGKFKCTTICPEEETDPEPPEPSGYGIRTIGFWKHQFNRAFGYKRGYVHIDSDTLLSYLAAIRDRSVIFEEEVALANQVDALEVLELRGKHSMFDRCVQQLLAVWLNYVSGNEFNQYSESLEVLILDTEAALLTLLDDDPTNDADIEVFKDLCDAMNNSGYE
jgi:hypothetical protein